MSDYTGESQMGRTEDGGNAMEELLSWAGRARCIRIVSTGAVGRRLLVRLRCFEASGGARAFHMSKE